MLFRLSVLLLLQKNVGPGNVLALILVMFAGQLGDQLQQQAANETASLKPAHSYVPWVTVDGIPIGGAYEQLQTFICADYKGQRLVACFQPWPGSHPPCLQKCIHKYFTSEHSLPTRIEHGGS